LTLQEIKSYFSLVCFYGHAIVEGYYTFVTSYLGEQTQHGMLLAIFMVPNAGRIFV